MSRSRNLSASFLLGGSVIGLCAPAFAQDSVEGTTANEIIVTAQRRAERLEDVPLSIVAVQAETLEKSGIRNPTDINQLVAGANVTRSGALVQPTIRGVTSLTSGWSFENGTALYIDGFYQPDMVSLGNDFSNVKSVQVLKGPQGALYGRNAMAGAIVIETLDPSDVPTANGSLSFGRYNDVRAEGYVSVPINDFIGASISAYRRVNDGYMTDIGGDPFSEVDDFDAAPSKQTALRAKVKISPAEMLDVTLGYSYTYSNVSVGLLFHPYRNLNANSDPLNLPPFRAIGDFQVSQSLQTDNALVVRNYTAKVELDTGIGTFTSYTGWNRRKSKFAYDFDGSKLVSFEARNPFDRNYARTFQQTLDFVIDKIDRLDLIIGASYYRDRVVTGSDSFTDFPPADGVADLFRQTETHSGAKAYAGYIDVTYEIVDRLFLSAGARYTLEKRSVDYVEGFGFLGSATETFKDLTPHANIRYEIAPRTNVYVSYSEGFRSGVFNPSPPAIPIRPEKIQSYEIGFKTASSAWRLDAAAYYYDYTNLQVATVQPDPDCDLPNQDECNVITLTANAKGAEGYGGELQLTWSPIEALNVRAGISYNHAEYTDFDNAVGTGFDATGATNVGNGTNVSGQRQDWSGQQLARAPKWTGNVGGDFSFGLGSGEMTLTSNFSFSSSFVSRDPSLWGPLAAPLADPDQQRFRTAGYVLVNAQANWTDPSGHYTIGVYCNNCTDTKYENYESAGGFGDYHLFNEPATYGGRIGFKF